MICIIIFYHFLFLASGYFYKNIDKYIKLQPSDAKQLRRTQTQSLNNKHHNVKIVDGDELMNNLLLTSI